MLFNSYIFILLFLPIALIGYYLINYTGKYKISLLFLSGMSLWFYSYFNPRYILIISTSIILNYCISRMLMKQSSTSLRKRLLILGITGNLASIFYFKYFDFFITNINTVFKTDFTLKNILLPLGISFFTFQQISYLVDSFRRETGHYSFVEYVTFVTFFPQLVAGPIVTHDEMMPQFRDVNRKGVNYENLCIGLYSFAMGLGKKVLLADSFSVIATTGYSNIKALDSTNAIFVMLAYSLQLYFDFSGYSDMAVGIGKMFNIDIMANFNSPFKAKNVADLWNRWHISLNRFLIRYVYIPLGGSRKGRNRTYMNTLIVFFLSGLWHGANWTFVLWGILNGVAVIIYRILQKYFDKLPEKINTFITFLIFNFTFVFFRAESVRDGSRFLKKIFACDFGSISTELANAMEGLLEIKILSRIVPQGIMTYIPGFFVLGIVIIGLIAVFTMKNTQEKAKEGVLSMKRLFSTGIILVWCILSFSGVSEFLYFNF